MDWDTKIPPWDLPELERYSEPNIGSVVSGLSNACQDRHKSGIDCSVDLKLGGLGDFESSSRWKENTKVSTSAISPSGPSKRARAPSNGNQNVSCLVDGCKSDLSNCRDYHRRHKVCEAHSKTPMVLVGDQEQRFCQQCSRFHLLVEFDEVKRSCRKRLDGHNRRRRKPQSDPLSTGGSLQGTRFSSYSHMFPNLASDPTWSAVVKNERNGPYRFHPQSHYMDRERIFPSPFACSSRVEKRLPFLRENDAVTSDRTLQQQQQTSVCQPLLNTISFSASGSNGGKMFSGISQVSDSDCVLSLLSSPTQTTPAVNISHIVPADRISVAQPLAQIQQQQQYNSFDGYMLSQSSNTVSTTGFLCSGMGNNHISSTPVLVPDANGSDLQSPVLFHVVGGDPRHGPNSLLPFSSWP